MTRLDMDTAETLAGYLKEAGGSLFSLRNSFRPRAGKRMSQADTARFADIYRRTRRALLGDLQEEGLPGRRDFP